MNYRFGFSWKGLIIFLLPMIPNIFYFINPTLAQSASNPNSPIILDVLEHASQAIFIFFLIFVIRKQTSEKPQPYPITIAITLIAYYILWLIYFTCNTNLPILLGLAILPIIYFILAELHLQNHLAILPTLLFGIVHVIITYKN